MAGNRSVKTWIWAGAFSSGGGGGGLPYDKFGDARRKIRIKPLKETNLGVARVHLAQLRRGYT